MKKLLLGAAVVGLAVVVFVLSIETPDPRPRVETQEIAARDFVATVEASGVVRAAESVDLSAEVVGRLLEVRVRPGDSVVPGAIVALIDDATQRPIVEERRAALRQVETALADAEVSRRDAERERERAERLHAEGIVSERSVEEAAVALEHAEIAADRARQNIEGARSALERAEEDLRKTVVRSPMRGVVLSVELEEGELVVASSQNLPGSRIMTLGTADDLIVEAQLPELDVVRVETGQPVEISVTALGEGTLAGEVVEIQRVGERDDDTRFGSSARGAEFLGRIRVEDPPAELRPSMSAQVRIETDRRRDALAVPIGALLRRRPEGAREDRMFALSFGTGGTNLSGGATRGVGGDESWQAVFVVANGVVSERRVTTGLSDLFEVEITEGLAVGDRIVVGPPLLLRQLTDGDEVAGDGEVGDGEVGDSATAGSANPGSGSVR